MTAKRHRVAQCGRLVAEPSPRDALLERGVPLERFADESEAWCQGYLLALREFETHHSTQEPIQ